MRTQFRCLDASKKWLHRNGLSFGVKLTNTFPVDIKRQELPGEEMYMSGKALFPLSITVAARLAESFDGELPMSFSGGADQKNIDQIVGCRLWPVTVATVLLNRAAIKVSPYRRKGR